MAVSRLLKSCATPPARLPTASIFCEWCSCSCEARNAASARLRTDTSTTATRRARTSPSCRSFEVISTSKTSPEREILRHGIASTGSRFIVRTCSDRCAVSSGGRISNTVIWRNSSCVYPYRFTAALFTARNLKVSKSYTSIGKGDVSNRMRYRRSLSPSSLLRRSSATAMWLKVSASFPSSPSAVTRERCDRSPAANASASAVRAVTGPAIFLENSHARRRLTRSDAIPSNSVSRSCAYTGSSATSFGMPTYTCHGTFVL